MAGRSSQNQNRGANIFGYDASGKGDSWHSAQYAASISPSGIQASGGNVIDYPSSGDLWRCHVYNHPGTFVVSSIGTLGGEIEYWVVGGGGGGGRECGGGGAGGILSNTPWIAAPLKGGTYTVDAGTYTCTVGAGGEAGANAPTPSAADGEASDFHPAPVSHPAPSFLRAPGGGGGGSKRSAGGALTPNRDGRSGGCGGGDARDANNTTAPASDAPTVTGLLGTAGGTSPGSSSSSAGGGGGAGAAGQSASSDTGASGGAGIDCAITGTTMNYAAGGGGGGNAGPGGDGGAGPVWRPGPEP